MDWVARLAAFAVLLQACETFCLRQELSRQGAWAWEILCRDDAVRSPWLRGIFRCLMSEKAFLIIVILQGLIAVRVMESPSALWLVGLTGLTWLGTLRWRGSFNGGSDTMTLMSLGMASVALFFAPGHSWHEGARWFLAFQLVLSYWIPGFVKVRNPEWRSGYAFSRLLRESCYDIPRWLRAHSQKPWLMWGASWSLLLFQLSFPLVFQGRRWALVYLSCAALFHLLNFFVLGLNRFVWAWLAAYPALYTCFQGERA